MFTYKRSLTIILIVLLGFVVFSCMPVIHQGRHMTPSGFFSGIWHGWIAPISLIVGFFNRSIRIYDPYNTGWWYDFGFYIAVISGFGGISLARRHKSD